MDGREFFDAMDEATHEFTSGKLGGCGFPDAFSLIEIEVLIAQFNCKE